MEQEKICYHHFSFTFDPKEIINRFTDVRFVLIAGCALRTEAQAKYLTENLFNGIRLPKLTHDKLTKPTSRFTLFKIGPVLVSNHGMGSPSMSIAMHELFIMCREAGVLDKITLIRFGSCGGLGVNPGTLCVTNKALNPLFQDYVELKICARLVRRDCVVDQKTASLMADLVKLTPNHERLGNYDIQIGATIAADDFYEEQGRTNGCICEHSLADKMEYLKKARDLGVINMEMESNFLAAMCHKLNVSFAVICVALNNRLISDKITITSDDLAKFEERLFWANCLFIEHKLSH